MTAETWEQIHFRGRNDTVALCTNTWTFALNANFSFDVNLNFRVRFKIYNTSVNTQTLAPAVRFSTTGINGTYTACGAGTAVKLSATSQYANDALISPSTCSFLGTVGSGNVQGQASSGGTLSSWSVGADRATETEWCLQLDSTQLSGVSTVHLRIYDGNTALTTYTQTPAITVTGLASFDPQQTAYRFADDGTESGATLIGTLNTALSRDVTSDSNIQLRIRIQEAGGAAGASTDDWQLQRSINGGAFANVTTTSTGAKVNTGSALTDGGTTTNRLGAGTGSFVAGEQEEANGLVEDRQLTASNFTEHVWALTLVAADLLENDAITFRVLLNGAVLSAYTQTPTINVTKTFTPAQNAYQFAEDGTESGATLIGTLNTALSRNVASDSNLQLRVRIQETTGGSGASTDDWQLQRALNGGAFANVTSTSTVVKSFTTSQLTDGGTTTNRLGSGTGSFVAGEQEEANGLVEDRQLTGTNYTEHVWALTLIAADLAEADQITFRVLINGATMTYNQTPTINVTKTVAATSLLFAPRAPAMTAMLVQ